MKWRSCDFEGEADQSHDDSGEQKGREKLARKTFSDGGKTGCARHAINETQPKESKSAGGAAKEEILQAGFSRSDVGFVERSHEIKRQAGKFESGKDHEQLLAANEK